MRVAKIASFRHGERHTLSLLLTIFLLHSCGWKSHSYFACNQRSTLEQHAVLWYINKHIECILDYDGRVVYTIVKPTIRGNPDKPAPSRMQYTKQQKGPNPARYSPACFPSSCCGFSYSD